MAASGYKTLQDVTKRSARYREEWCWVSLTDESPSASLLFGYKWYKTVMKIIPVLPLETPCLLAVKKHCWLVSVRKCPRSGRQRETVS